MLKHFYSYACCGFAALIAFLFLNTTCSKNVANPTGSNIKCSLVETTDCKIPGDNCYSDNFHSTDEGMDYYYDGNGTLFLTHVNAAFDMCPGESFIEFSIDSNVITIEVTEAEHGCDAMCLYDLKYRLENLPFDQYFFKIITPYTKQIAPFEFSIDLNYTREGSFNIRRNFYPWEIES